MAIKGDFISFTYNGVHSTELGIVHVSASNRYTDALLPTIQDKTVLAAGSNGTYFFGSYYTLRLISLNIAYDEVSESQLRLARKVFGDLRSHPLIFDEEPYKIYYAKVTGTPQYTYIPFSTPRVYKGEGTLTFTCYEPFAHTLNNWKYLDQWQIVPDEYVETEVTAELYTGHESNYYILDNENYVLCTEEDEYNSTATYYTFSESYTTPNWYKYDNKNEWNLSANLLDELGSYDSYDSITGFKLYNPGDMETDFKLIIPTSLNFVIDGIVASNSLTGESRILTTSITSAKEGDISILFNSKTNLIEGLNAQGARTGNIYNDCVVSGEWFKIPLTTDGNWYLLILDYSNASETAPEIVYDYLYL